MSKSFIFALTASVFLMASCGSVVDSSKKTVAAESTDAAGGDPPVGGGVVDSAGFFVKFTPGGPANYVFHKASVDYGNDVPVDNFSEECRMTTGAMDEILCVLEIEELDLYFLDIAVQVHIPSGTCDYMAEAGFAFYAFEPGTGPNFVSYERNADGSITDGSNSSDGNPVCSYDYTEQNGPNCCVGDYTQSVITHNSDGSTQINTTQESWTGTVGNCLAGFGSTSNYERDFKGFPKTNLLPVPATGLNVSTTMPAPIDSGIGGTIGVVNNVWAANFYNPTEHGNDRPVAMRIPSNVTDSTFQYLPSDTFKISCLSHAEEELGVIRVMIRDWNTTPIAEGGDPDVTGTEASGGELNDRYDFFDFGSLYPSSSS